ncbi:unnamed protein product [Lampetra planeri]
MGCWAAEEPPQISGTTATQNALLGGRLSIDGESGYASSMAEDRHVERGAGRHEEHTLGDGAEESGENPPARCEASCDIDTCLDLSVARGFGGADCVPQ